MDRRLVPDRVRLGVTVILLCLGLVMLWSALQPLSIGGAIMARQLVGAVLGVVLMRSSTRFDYRELRSRYVALPILGIAMLLVLGALASPSVYELNRWIRLGDVSFQPSEFAKVAVVIFLASELERRAGRLSAIRNLIAPAYLVGVVALLVFVEPDLISSQHIALVASGVALLAGVPIRFFVIGGATLFSMAVLRTASASYRVARVLDFLGSWGRMDGTSNWHVPSLVAVGSGGLLGRGFMKGEQKALFLPCPHSAFIFAVVGEELGFAGALFVVVLFVVFLWRGLRIAQRAPDLFGRLLAAGLTMSIVSQAFINISAVLRLAPTRSLPLPFFSAGGTSLVMCLLSAGLILNVSQHTGRGQGI